MTIENVNLAILDTFHNVDTQIDGNQIIVSDGNKTVAALIPYFQMRIANGKLNVTDICEIITDLKKIF